MKSIMHEASSLAKAIEQGWEKAGKPKEFSIKILEEAQKNFIGMTTRSAKIAIVFDERQSKAEAPRIQQPKPAQRPLPRKEIAKEPREFTTAKQQALPRQTQQQQAERSVIQKPIVNEPQESTKPRSQKQFAPLWNDEMVAVAQEWIQGTLKTMNIDGVPFTVQPQNFHLRVVFQKPLLSEAGKEKQLFASFSTLILETLKGKFRIGLRGHKIVLTHEQ